MKLTAVELEAARRGKTAPFTDYSEDPAGAVVILPPWERKYLEDWCKPFLDAGIEMSGVVVFSVGWMLPELQTAIKIQRTYVNGGKTDFRQTMVVPDHEYIVNLVEHDFPEAIIREDEGLRKGFSSNRVGWWHLHCGDYPDLSVGDVEECRKAFDHNPSVSSLNLLVYFADGKFQVGAFIVRHDAVYRLKVVSE